MPRSSSYYTLIGSLPALPVHFEDAERVPISRRRLDERLKMLDPAAAEVISTAMTNNVTMWICVFMALSFFVG